MLFRSSKASLAAALGSPAVLSDAAAITPRVCLAGIEDADGWFGGTKIEAGQGRKSHDEEDDVVGLGG